jgi:hypothetical protein
MMANALPVSIRPPFGLRAKAIGASPGQQRPGDACHLVGKRNGHDLERSPRQELRQPGIVLRALLGAPEYGMRTDHQQAPQIAVALLGDRPKLLFAPVESCRVACSEVR